MKCNECRKQKKYVMSSLPETVRSSFIINKRIGVAIFSLSICGNPTEDVYMFVYVCITTHTHMLSGYPQNEEKTIHVNK